MFKWLTSLFGRPRPLDAASERLRRAEAVLQERWTQARCQLIEAAAESLQESGSLFAFDNLVDPREPLYDVEGFWLPLGSGEHLPPNIDNRKRGEVLPVYLTEYQLKVIRDQSRKQLAYNEFAINAIENRASYIVGCGFTYKVVRKGSDPSKPTGNDRLCRMTQDVIDRFRASCDWGELEQEIVIRDDRDGESFLRWFPHESGGVAVRVVEPEWVRSPSGSVEPQSSFGVETDPEDIEDRKGYHVVADPTISLVTEFVPADEILHIKLNTNRNAKRGLPTLLPVRKNLERAEKLLRNMSVLAQIQATFALIRKHKSYSGGAISAFQGQQTDVTFTAPITQKATNFQQYMPGSIIDTGDGTEYEFPAAGIAASEYVNILQAELRAVAARLCMPEYMLTADASNANYASTLVAEAPAVKHFERLQDFYARKFGKGCYRPGPHCGAMWRVIEIAVRMGKLPREVLTECELQVEGPSLTVRDRTQETNRYKTLNESGVMSKREWATSEGLDYDKQQAQIKTEPQSQSQSQGGEGGLGGLFGGGDDGDDDGNEGGGSEGDFPFDLGEGEGWDESKHKRDDGGKFSSTGGGGGSHGEKVDAWKKEVASIKADYERSHAEWQKADTKAREEHAAWQGRQQKREAVRQSLEVNHVDAARSKASASIGPAPRFDGDAARWEAFKEGAEGYAKRHVEAFGKAFGPEGELSGKLAAMGADTEKVKALGEKGLAAMGKAAERRDKAYARYAAIGDKQREHEAKEPEDKESGAWEAWNDKNDELYEKASELADALDSADEALDTVWETFGEKLSAEVERQEEGVEARLDKEEESDDEPTHPDDLDDPPEEPDYPDEPEPDEEDDTTEACVPNRSGNRHHDDKTGRPCKKGDKHGEPGQAQHHVTVDYAKQHLASVKADLTPEKVIALADTLSRLTGKELRQLKREMGLKLDKASWRKKDAMAAKIADEATRRITEDEGFQRQARAERLNWKEVRGYAEMYRETANQTIDTINRCVSEAREMYKSMTGGGALTRRLKAFDGGDHAGIKAFDVISRSMAQNYPEILGAHGYSHHAGYDPDAEQASERLYELIAAGKQERVTRRAAYEHAISALTDERDRKTDEVPF